MRFAPPWTRPYIDAVTRRELTRISDRRDLMERASLIGMCALLLIPLGVHGYIGTFMRLVGGDDFCYTNLAAANSVFETASYIYTHQQGRMTSNVLLDLLPLIEPTRTPALTM